MSSDKNHIICCKGCYEIGKKETKESYAVMLKSYERENEKDKKRIEELLEEKEIKEKLQKFERYFRRLNFQYPGSKKNMIFNFHSIFKEEMKETETGKRWRKKVYGNK